MGAQWNLTPAPTEKDNAICPPHASILPRRHTHTHTHTHTHWVQGCNLERLCRQCLICLSSSQQHVGRWASLCVSRCTVHRPSGNHQPITAAPNLRHEWQDTSWSASSLDWRGERQSSVGPFKLKWLNSSVGSLKVEVTQIAGCCDV